MELNFDDISNIDIQDSNPYVFVSSDSSVEPAELKNVIQIIDESGAGVSYTYDKFIEVFDKKGLSGFIL